MRIIALVTTIGSVMLSSNFVLSDEDEDGEETSAQSRSSLLVLLAASDPASVAVERQLVAELRLTLDGLQVEQIAIERGDFLNTTLPEQLLVVQPLIRRFKAKAAVWVTAGGTTGHLIQFVVSEQGNATVRTVEAGSPEDLALAVSELLEQTYLFDPSTSRKKDSTELPPARFSIGTSVGMIGGMYGHDGASICGGMGIQARVRPSERLSTGLSLDGKVGPREDLKEGLFIGRHVGIRWFMAYIYQKKRVGFGPLIELGAHYSTINTVINDGQDFTESWWSFRGGLGFELTIEVSSRFVLFWDASFGGNAPQKIFKTKSTEDHILTTPILDYSFNIGIQMGVI